MKNLTEPKTSDFDISAQRSIYKLSNFEKDRLKVKSKRENDDLDD